MYKSVLSIAIGSLFLSGCASINTGGWKDSIGLSSEGSASLQQSYEDQFSRSLYATVGIGPSRMEPDASELPGLDQDDRVEPAGQITVGADLYKHLSIEAHSADLGSAGFSPGGRLNYHVNGVSALIYAGGNRDRFRRQGLSAYGRVGYGFLENTAIGNVPILEENRSNLLIGAGLEYMTPIGVGLRAEAFSFDQDAQYAQLALMYRTGKKQSKALPKLSAAPKIVVEPKIQPVVAAALPPPQLVSALPKPDRCTGLNGVLDGVNFQNNSAELTGDSTLVLSDVAYILSTCEKVQVEVSAHTDSVGPASYNQELSERRANSVIDYLETRGLSRNRLSISAFGESSPIETNTTSEGRALNRRVELYAR